MRPNERTTKKTATSSTLTTMDSFHFVVAVSVVVKGIFEWDEREASHAASF